MQKIINFIRTKTEFFKVRTLAFATLISTIFYSHAYAVTVPSESDIMGYISEGVDIFGVFSSAGLLISALYNLVVYFRNHGGEGQEEQVSKKALERSIYSFIAAVFVFAMVTIMKKMLGIS